jgi:hypothetical protein
MLMFKNFYNRANIITKYQVIFLREKSFKLILAIGKETYFGGEVLPF